MMLVLTISIMLRSMVYVQFTFIIMYIVFKYLIYLIKAGSAETVMGNVLKKAGWKRSDLVISTKVFLFFLIF